MSVFRKLEAEHAVLERALDLGVERVQPVQRERLGRGEALPGGRVGAVVEEHAVLEREPRARRRARAGAWAAIRRRPSSMWPSSRPSALRAISAP